MKRVNALLLIIREPICSKSSQSTSIISPEQITCFSSWSKRIVTLRCGSMSAKKIPS